MTAYDRLRQFIRYKDLTLPDFEKKVGLTKNYVTNTKNPTTEMLEKISVAFPDLNMHWLISGSGAMIIRKTKSTRGIYSNNIKVNNIQNNIIDKESVIFEKYLDIINRKDLEIARLSQKLANLECRGGACLRH
jgi:transcriptional regulator with XRE-family HTH domain